jgi:hypothetical protein
LVAHNDHNRPGESLPLRIFPKLDPGEKPATAKEIEERGKALTDWIYSKTYRKNPNLKFEEPGDDAAPAEEKATAGSSDAKTCRLRSRRRIRLSQPAISTKRTMHLPEAGPKKQWTTDRECEVKGC